MRIYSANVFKNMAYKFDLANVCMLHMYVARCSLLDQPFSYHGVSYVLSTCQPHSPCRVPCLCPHKK